MTIYLDMDGVCCDFVTSFLVHYGAKIQSDQVTKWEMHEILGITEDQFWDAINSYGESFWSGMAEFPWYSELYHLCRDYGEVIFLTSPGRSPTAASGKLKWLHKRFGATFQDFVLTKRKDLLAKCRQDILIDDGDHFADLWSAAGGTAIVFPQPWNRKRHAVGERLIHVERELDRL